MPPEDKTKQESVAEIAISQQRVAELEQLYIKLKREHQCAQRFETVVRDSNDSIIIQDIAGRITAWNRGAELMYGYSEQEAIGRSIEHFTPLHKLAEHKEFSRRLIAGESVPSFETQRVAKDGRVFDVWLTVTKVVEKPIDSIISTGRDLTNPVGIALIERNVSERKKNEEKYQTIIKSSIDGFWQVDGQGNITDTNDAYCGMLGYSRAEILTMNVSDIEACESPHKVQEHIHTAKEAGSDRFETRQKRKNGAIIDVDMSLTFMKSIDRIFVFARDMTQRKKTEESLRQSEGRYRKQFEEAIDAIFLADLQTGVILDCNIAATKLVEREKQDIIGKHQTFLHPNQDTVEGFSKTFIVYAVGEPATLFEERVVTKSGQIKHVSIRASKIILEGKEVLQGIFRDITQSKTQEMWQDLSHRSLKILNQDYEIKQTIRDISMLIKQYTGVDAVGIRLRDKEDYPYYEAQGFSEDFIKKEVSLCGYDEKGNSIRDEHGKVVLACMCGNILCGRTDPQQPFFTENGSFWTNCTTELLAGTTEKERQLPTRNECNKAGYESVALIPLRMGNEIIGLLQLNDHQRGRFTLDMIKFFEGLGAGIGMALFRKQAEDDLACQARALAANVAELKKMQAQLINAEKLAGIGRLAAAVTHELRNPLTYITANIALLEPYVQRIAEALAELEKNSENALPECVEKIAVFKTKFFKTYTEMEQLLKDSGEGCSRINDIIARLLDYARSDSGVMQPTDISRVINKAVVFVANEIKYKCKVEKDLQELPLVLCNHREIEQVFVNLFVNSAQAVRKNGLLRVKNYLDDGFVVTEISDNGIGIAKENVDKIFEPFFTTKKEGEGTGLGLAIVHRIIERHGGSICVTSEEGVGTTFIIRLPVCI